MPRFPFSRSGWRKQPILTPVDVPPMSKAHKILGSTPLNIDVPGVRDDGSSDVFTDGPSVATTASCYGSEFGPDDFGAHQDLTGLDQEEWNEESNINSCPLKLSSLGFPIQADLTPLEPVTTVRKRRSSSTIRSWYEKSKLPLVMSQQTSSAVVVKGLPARNQSSLGPVCEETPKTKRRPARLDLSLTRRGGIGGSRQMVQNAAIVPEPELIPSSSPLSIPSHDLNLHTQPSETRHDIPDVSLFRPRTSSSNRFNLASQKTPSLYDHYEQMSLRHIWRQSSTPNLQSVEAGALFFDDMTIADSEGEVAHSEVHVTYAIPETPTTAVLAREDWRQVPSGPARSISSRHTKTSKMSGTSKNTKSSLEGTDLLQTSVLILSSDSESDDDDDHSVTPSIPGRSQLSLGRDPEQYHTETLHTTSSSKIAQAPNLAQDQSLSSMESSAGMESSAASNVFTTAHRQPNTGRTTPASDGSGSEIGLPKAHIAESSSGSSSTSDCSSISGITWQDEPRCDIQEARAITVLPARCPSDNDADIRSFETSSAAGTASECHSPMKTPIASRVPSTDQLTPPLSPSSVDFYIRSAHTSVDGFGSHSRLMVVTHQEEKILAALRQKHQPMRFPSLSQVSDRGQDMGHSKLTAAARGRDAEDGRKARAVSSNATATKGHQSKGSQTTITSAAFDFDLSSGSSTPEKPYSASTRLNVTPIRTTSLMYRPRLVPTSPVGPPPTFSLPELPKHRSSIPFPTRYSSRGQQDVPLYLDDSEPSPDMDDIRDWELATSPIVETMSPRCVHGTPWRNVWSNARGSEQADPSEGDSPARSPRECYFRAHVGESDHAVWEGNEIINECRDVPRPDSPVSPDIFPEESTERMSCGNVVRLSAVGAGA